MIALFEAGLPPPVRLEMMREDPPLTFAASRLRAKKHAAHHTTTQTISATAAETVIPTQPTPQPSRLPNAAPQNEDLLRQMVSSIASLQQQQTRTHTPASSAETHKPRSATPRPNNGKQRRDRKPSPEQRKRSKTTPGTGDQATAPLCKYHRCRSRLRDHPTSECRTLQQNEKTWGIRWPGRDE